MHFVLEVKQKEQGLNKCFWTIWSLSICVLQFCCKLSYLSFFTQTLFEMEYEPDVPFIAPYSFRIYIQNNDLEHLDRNHRLLLTDWNEFGKGGTSRELKGKKKGIKGSRLNISSNINRKLQKIGKSKAEKYRRFYNSFKRIFPLISRPTEKLFGVRYSKDMKHERKIGRKIWGFNFLENCSKSWIVMDNLFEKMIALDFRMPRVLDSKSRIILSKWMTENGEKEMSDRDICKKLLSCLLLLTQIDKKNMMSHVLIDTNVYGKCQLEKDELERLKGDFMKPLPKQKFKLGVSSMFHALDNYSFGIEIREPNEKKEKIDEEVIRRGVKRKLDGFLKYKANCKTIESNTNPKLCLTTKELMLPSRFSSSYKPGDNGRRVDVSSKNIFEEGGGCVYDTRMHNAKQVVLYLSFNDLISVQGENGKLKDAIRVIDGNRSLQIALLLRLDLAFVNGIANGPKIEDFVVYNTVLNEDMEPIFPFEKKAAIFPSSNNSAFNKDCIDVTCDPSLELCSRECIHDGFSKPDKKISSSCNVKANHSAAFICSQTNDVDLSSALSTDNEDELEEM